MNALCTFFIILSKTETSITLHGLFRVNELTNDMGSKSEE